MSQGRIMFTPIGLADTCLTIRHKLGDTQEQIAQMADVDRRTVIAFEQGKWENLSFDTVVRLLRSVNLELDIEVENEQ